MSSLFFTVLQTTLACAQLAGAAAGREHSVVVVDLTVVDRAGSAFQGPLSLRLRQRVPDVSEEWTTGAIEFESTGRLEQAVVGLGGVDPAWAIWARVERNVRGRAFGASSGAFYGDDDSPCRGTVSLRLPTAPADPPRPPRLRGTVVVDETPVYAQVRVLGATADAPHRICMWAPWSRALERSRQGREHNVIDAEPAPALTAVRSFSEAASTPFHILDPDGRLVHTGEIKRGAVTEVDVTRAGHVLVDAGDGWRRVFVVPRAEYAPPTQRERTNDEGKQARLRRLGAYQCWPESYDGDFLSPEPDGSAYLAECRAPGVHVVEVWHEHGSDDPPLTPHHVAEVVVRAGVAVRHEVR